MKKLFTFFTSLFSILFINSQCDYTINMQDSWGDGWNGASIDVDVNGVNTNVTLTGGSAGTQTVSAFTGDVVTFTFNSGTFDNEITFDITDPGGNLIGNYGPNPTVGLFYTDPSSNSTCPPPSCSDPNSLSASSVFANSANLVWNAGGTETAWNVEWDLSGFTQGAGNLISGTTTNPQNITGLTASTSYDFYVQADCGANGTSNWVGPFTFTTACNTFTAPAWAEGFESAGSLPTCWSMSGGENWLFNTTGPNHVGNNGTLSGTTITNSYYAVVDASGSDAPATLTSPYVDLSALANPQLSFYEISDNEGNANSTLDVEVWDGSAWINVATYNTNTAGWEKKEISLSSITFTGPAAVRFTFSETVPGDFYDDIAIDDVTFEEAPNCPAPINIATSNATSNSVDISWSSSASFSNIEYGASGFAQGTGTLINSVSTNPYTLTGLNPATSYDFYIQDTCGNNGASNWVGPISFFTLIPAPNGVSCTTGNAAFVFSDDMDANNGWTGNIGNANGEWDFPTAAPGGNSTSTGPSGPAPGTGTTWAEYEASGNSTTVASLVTPMIDLSASSGPAELSFYMHAYGTAIGLLNVGVGNSATGPFTTEFTWAGQYQTAETDPWAHIGVDLTAYQGQQIYIEFSYRGDGSDWTGDLAIDFVQVETCLSCAIPSNLSAANITDSSADLLWTAGGTETSWVVYLDSAGFSPGPSTAINATNDTLNITGLAQSTDYQFYVQALCGTDSSALAGPFSFTTLFTPCSPLSPATLPFIEDFSGTTGSGVLTGDGNIYCGNTYKWTFQTTDQVNGRVTWGSQYPGLPSSGTGALALDAAVNSVVPDPINEAILTVDLSSYSASQNLEFDFEFYDQGDEVDANDRVWIRGSDTSCLG